MPGVIFSRKEAKESGEKFYFTGMPCVNGHIDKRQTSNGCCYTCSKARNMQYMNANPEKIRARREANKENIREKNADWRRRNLESIKSRLKETFPERSAAQKAYYEKNREALLAKARDLYAENKDRFYAYSKARYARVRLDPEFRLSKVMRQNIRRLLFDKAGVSTVDILGYDASALKDHLESKWSTGMSWDNYGEWHIDHIVPISVMVKKVTKDPRIINALENLQPLWAFDNLSKGSRITDTVDKCQR